MGRFAPKYTAEQKAAICRAVIDQRWTAGKVVEAARQGRLPDCDPFHVPQSSVYAIARTEKQRLAGLRQSPLTNKPPDEALDDIYKRLLSIVDDELRTLERKRGPKQGPTLNRLLANGRQLASMAAALPSKRHGQGGKQDAKPEQQGFLDTLTKSPTSASPSKLTIKAGSLLAPTVAGVSAHATPEAQGAAPARHLASVPDDTGPDA